MSKITSGIDCPGKEWFFSILCDGINIALKKDMMTFRGERLAKLTLPPGTLWLLGKLAESKERQAVGEKKSPGFLKNLHEIAFLESVESSNRIDGVTVEPERLRLLVLDNARPRDRSEEEIIGYGKALTWIHGKHDQASIERGTVQYLHALAQEGTVGDAGKWKVSQNEIVDVDPEGVLKIRFQPVEPALVPRAVAELCGAYKQCIDRSSVAALVAVACLVFDFLCIHPFREGNGRVSRLLTLLALYQHGYDVGRYVGLERIIEQSKAAYYDALQSSSMGWQDGSHDVIPWVHYFLSTIHTAYRQFEESAGQTG